MRRRQWLKAGGAALAAPLVAPLMRPLDAFAKTDQIVVMTWGGQWGDAMRDNVDAAYEKTTGIKVVQERGGRASNTGFQRRQACNAENGSRSAARRSRHR